MTSETEGQAANNVEDKKHKQKRCRTLQEQIEFYFSDANLAKDKFLSELLNEADDGYVDLSVFLKFNKIKALTNNVEEIAASLEKSTFLHVSEDGKFVKRLTPVQINDQVDHCTIYVENLPSNADHEWVKEKFKTFGKVAYVSLPKFRISGKIKGFAFVEFDSKEAAENACKAFTSGESAEIGEAAKPIKESHSDVEDEPSRKRIKLEQPSENEFVIPESVGGSEKKRRKRRKDRKEKKKMSENQSLKLRVISKLEWKRYRNKYLTLQKANMAQLKKYLELQHHSEESIAQEPVEEVQTAAQAPEFVANVIIKLTFSEPVKDAKPLRNEIKSEIGVRYVELKDETTCSYIRCDCPEITKSVLESVKSKGDAVIIQGEEEKMYWDKIAEDRNIKLNNKRRPKKRGFDKIIHKAINLNMAKLATHIRFDD